jgi:ubiquinone/menaquinone biosynthesis C-methylase UbiE
MTVTQYEGRLRVPYLPTRLEVRWNEIGSSGCSSMVLGRGPTIRNLVPQLIRSRIPEKVRAELLAKYVLVRDSLVDPIEYWVSNRSGEFTPSKLLIRSAGYGGNVTIFKFEGRKQLRYCVELGHLKPDGSMLEVGSGMGRLASAISKYLNEKGRYEGLDINKIGIGWCQRNISPRYPNFRFNAVDVYNRGYNPKGRINQSEYRFPYGDEAFDLVYSYSVFTHMTLEDTGHYLSEMSRVLKTGGMCINTFLLLNQKSRLLMEAGQSNFDPKYQIGLSRFWKDVPESTIAHDEEEVRTAYQKSGLQIVNPIRYGGWPGREKFVDGQDIIVARKETLL